MINRVLEWYRIVNAKPTPEIVDRRISSVTDLVKEFEGQELDVLLQAVAGVVSGFESGHSQDSPVVASVIRALKAKDSSVPSDLHDNALEIRAMTAAALGELMTRGSEPDNEAVMLAVLFQSGLGFRSPVKERHLQIMLQELQDASERTLQQAQESKRKRTLIKAKKLLATDDNSTDDPKAALKSFATAVKSTINEFINQANIDREELDILWWLFAGASSTLDLPLSELAGGKAAICVGVEVADLCLLPPPSNANAFVRRAMEHVKKADVKRSLEALIGETDASVWALLGTDAKQSIGTGIGYPVVFPLSWLCRRLGEGVATNGWISEFRANTGLEATQSLSSLSMAEQVLRERVARKFYLTLVEE